MKTHKGYLDYLKQAKDVGLFTEEQVERMFFEYTHRADGESTAQERAVRIGKMRKCKNCGVAVRLKYRRCPSCDGWTTYENEKRYAPHKRSNSNPYTNEIVQDVDLGTKTLNDIGKFYGISRERVRQIYKEHTGKPARNRILNKQSEKEKTQQELLQKVKYTCVGCAKSVTHKEAGRKHKYCRRCHRIFKSYRDPQRIYQCRMCNSDFHPLRIVRYSDKEKGDYCSMSCYKKSVTFYLFMQKKNAERVDVFRKRNKLFEERR